MNTNVKIYLQYKTKEINDIDEKNNIAYKFFIRFSNYAQANNVNIEDLFDDFSSMVELDETLSKQEAMGNAEEAFGEIMGGI